MEEFVRGLFHEQRPKTRHQPRPSEAFSWHFRRAARNRTADPRALDIQAADVLQRAQPTTAPFAWLIDTNVISELIRPRSDPRVVAFLDLITEEGLGFASIAAWKIFDSIGRVPLSHRRDDLTGRSHDLLNECSRIESSIGGLPIPEVVLHLRRHYGKRSSACGSAGRLRPGHDSRGCYRFPLARDSNPLNERLSQHRRRNRRSLCHHAAMRRSVVFSDSHRTDHMTRPDALPKPNQSRSLRSFALWIWRCAQPPSTDRGRSTKSCTEDGFNQTVISPQTGCTPFDNSLSPGMPSSSR